MKKNKTLEMVQLAVLIAIMLILAFTPLGYLRIGPLAISLMTIPVVIGAMLLGPTGGAVLGLVFGLTSFYQCFAGDPFGAALVAMNPFFTFLVCIPTRTLMGWLSGVIFKALWKIDKTKTVTYFVTGLLGAFMNTLFFMSTLMICFGHTEYECNRSESVYVRRSILWYQRSTGDAYELCSRWWRCEGSQRSAEEECNNRREIIRFSETKNI